jgi:hypothetical protein
MKKRRKEEKKVERRERWNGVERDEEDEERNLGKV